MLLLQHQVNHFRNITVADSVPIRALNHFYWQFRFPSVRDCQSIASAFSDLLAGSAGVLFAFGAREPFLQPLRWAVKLVLLIRNLGDQETMSTMPNISGKAQSSEATKQAVAFISGIRENIVGVGLVKDRCS